LGKVVENSITVYDYSNGLNSPKIPKWASGAKGSGDYMLCMENTRKLVIYNRGVGSVWSSS